MASQRILAVSDKTKRSDPHELQLVEEGMAMLCHRLAAGALAAVICWNWTAAAHAGDIFRLGLNGEAPTFNLKGDGGAQDVLPVWGRRYAAGYYSGYYSGYSGAYYPRWGYYGSYYYPRYYGSYYPGYYGAYYPGYYGSYYPGYYSYYPGYYGYSYYYPTYYPAITYVSPIGCRPGSQDVPATVLTPGGQVTTDTYKLPAAAPDRMQPVPQDGTYRYDGGPSNPVPLPRTEPAPAGNARPQTVPLDGRPVSLPPAVPKKKYEYLAYGEKPAAAAAPEPPKGSFAQDRIVVLRADSAKKAPR
jgi:hypothetical protein